MTTISSDVIRGYNDTIILYLLLDRPSYGYEISRMILQNDPYDLRREVCDQGDDFVLRIYAHGEERVYHFFFPERGERQTPHLLQYYGCGQRVLQREVRGVEPHERSDRTIYLPGRGSRAARKAVNNRKETSWKRSETI